MNWERQIKKIALVLVSIAALGVVGFMAIEGWSLLDALYMTVLTISTVGYREVHPLTEAGKAFTIALIVLGVGSFLYIITTIADFVVSGRFESALGRRKMKKRIDALKGHYIVCGFGRVGRQVVLELEREHVPFVIVDNRVESLSSQRSKDYLFVEGDATNDDVLRDAGILRAKGLVTAIDSDADNVYVTLSAKTLNPDLLVVARASVDETQHKLVKAGADRVISPFSLGGRRLASLLLRPAVVEFLDVVMHSEDIKLFMEEVVINESSPFVGKTMEEVRQKCAASANILAIKKMGQELIIPSAEPDTVVEKGDRFVALGTREQLREIEFLS